MKLTTTANFTYELGAETTLFLSFLVSRKGNQKILSEKLNISPRKATVKELGPRDNQPRMLRITAPPGPLSIDYKAIVRTKPVYIQRDKIKSTSIAEFNKDIIPYAFPSRYCPSDRMRDIAGELFGQCKTPMETASAISEWIYKNISYTAGVTFEQTAADEVFELKKGVCRDFAHLGITLCRALNIPARYVSVYAYNLVPMDFHACFEAWIGGQWIIFDPTHMAALNAVARIATGLDASTVAVASIYGNVTNFTLSNDCTSEEEIELDVQGTLEEKGMVISLGK